MPQIPEISFQTVNEEINDALLKALETNQNLVNTSAISTINNFDRIASEAYVAVASGRKTSDSAIRGAINELVSGGTIKVQYPSGRKINIASALGTNVRTSLKQATMEISEDLGRQLGATHWEVSAHGDCADDHLWLQGIIVKDGSAKHHDVLDALKRPNCRHSISPFLKGFSHPADYKLPTREKIRAQYAREQYENRVDNARRKVRLEQRLDASVLEREGIVSEFANKTITQTEKIIVKSKVENAIIFDSAGKAIVDSVGTEHNVGITPQIANIVKKGGYTFTHNHPITGGSFSEQDLQVLAELNLREIRAVDDEYLYIARPSKKGWGDADILYVIHQNNTDDAQIEFSERVAKIPNISETTKIRIWREVLDKAMKLTAQEADIIYIRKKR